MPTFYHAPHSRSTAILTLVHELGDPADLDIVRIDIRRGDGSGASDPANPHPEGKAPVIVDAGDMIRADHLSQGQINGFPTYRFRDGKVIWVRRG